MIVNIKRILTVATASLAILSGCTPNAKNKILPESALYNLKTGEMVSVSSLVKIRFDELCFLAPNQQSVSAAEPSSEKINAFLRKNNYLGDENHWAMLFISGDIIHLERYERAEQLDMMGDHELAGNRQHWSNGFTPAVCAPAHTASLLKIRLRDRDFIILGSK